MKNRSIGGLLLILVGLILILIPLVFWMEAWLVFLIYGVPILIIGIVIFFNRREDKIEEIEYSKIGKVKGGKKL